MRVANTIFNIYLFVWLRWSDLVHCKRKYITNLMYLLHIDLACDLQQADNCCNVNNKTVTFSWVVRVDDY